jgi:hypothetical protein
MLNPLTASFPEPFIIPLDVLPELAPTLRLLFCESSSDLPGRQTALFAFSSPEATQPSHQKDIESWRFSGMAAFCTCCGADCVSQMEDATS